MKQKKKIKGEDVMMECRLKVMLEGSGSPDKYNTLLGFNPNGDRKKEEDYLFHPIWLDEGNIPRMRGWWNYHMSLSNGALAYDVLRFNYEGF